MKKISRRSFVRASLLAAGGVFSAAGCSQLESKTPVSYAFGGAGEDVSAALSPTPACGADSAVATTSEIEGPYYTPSTPLRRSLLEETIGGQRLQLVGRVVDEQCRPIPGAVLDFWQADAGGAYDNEGYELRGHQFTDGRGRYRLDTVVPGRYSDGWIERTPHLHVKVQGLETPLLTTQLYLPGEAERNAKDRFYHPELLMTETPTSNETRLALRFDFVLKSTGAT